MTTSKILIVDDSPVDLANLKSIIEEAGYSVVTASDGEEAYKIAKSARPDLILMDVVMEGVDGYEACRRITSDQETGKIPVIFVTSKNQKADEVWAKIQGGKAVIPKPYKSEQILSAIRSA